MRSALVFGDIEIDAREYRLRVRGVPQPLGRRAFALLVALAERPGRLVSKDDLLGAVWGGTIVEEANLHVHVSALRKALGPDVIATVPGLGYRFTRLADAAPSGTVPDGPTTAQMPMPMPTPAPMPVPMPGNLGLASPVLYGRADELAGVLAALRAHRLVTLLGIGGVGKTTLALAVAHAEPSSWPAGAWFVDMAPVTEPDHIVASMALSLGLALSPHRDPLGELAQQIADRKVLIVIDNAEHLCAAISALVAALLARTTHLRVLVTSRQALRLPEEQRFPLAGLSAPTEFDPSDPQRQGALALFEARVRALDPRFRLTADNAFAAVSVCRRLDGLPLAIELAAARVPVLGLKGLRDRLHRSLRVLGTRSTIGAPRHQTLRATFDWTHALLPIREQTLLRRLAVFVGGFSLALAEDLTAGPLPAAAGRERDADEMLDDLGALVEKSLVVVSDTDPPRYRLLEVTRAFALDKLAEAGELHSFSMRHAQAVWRLFSGAEAGLNERTDGALSRRQFLGRLSPELDNLRAALAWGEAADDRVLGAGLAAASTEALRLLGLSTEALRTMLVWRDRVDDSLPPEIAELFWTSVCALGTHGRLSRADMLVVIDRAERLYRRVGSPRRAHVGLYRKGFALLHLGQLDGAQQAVDEMASLEDPAWPVRALVQRLNLLGALDLARCRFESSVEAFESAAAMLASEPDESDVMLNVLSNLSMSLLGDERDEEALAVADDVLARDPTPVIRNITLRARMAALTFLGRLGEARAVARETMTNWLADDMLLHMLSVFAWLAYRQGCVADAVRLDGAARTKGARMGLSNMPVFDRARSNLKRALSNAPVDPARIQAWQREGEQLDQEEIVAICTRDPRPEAAAAQDGADRSSGLARLR